MENQNKKLNILMLAWRDLQNPDKGGAEIVTDIYLSHLAKHHNVTLFTSRPKSSNLMDEHNNYKILRQGNKLSVYLKAIMYARKHQKEYDIIIDQVNTIPFFTPLFIEKQKRFSYFNQLCLNVWFYETIFPINIIGYILERLYLKLYKNEKILTISESTKQDLIKYCNAKPENIFISEMQVDMPIAKYTSKKDNQFIYVGRIKKSKRIHDIIKAFSIVVKSNENAISHNPNVGSLSEVSNLNSLNYNPSKSNKSSSVKLIDSNATNYSKPAQSTLISDKLKLYIVGTGDQAYKDKLIKLSDSLNLGNRVIFTGNLSNKDRNTLMARSLAILVTSVREGWGLIVTEANANGTLAITYNTEGLRDANKSGIITKQNTPEALSQEMSKVLEDKNLTHKLSKSSLDFAKTHNSWAKQCTEVEKWLLN